LLVPHCWGIASKQKRVLLCGLHQLFPCVYSASCGLSFCTARTSCPPSMHTRSCQRFVCVLSACSLAASVVFAGSSVLPYHYCTLLLRPPCKIQCFLQYHVQTSAKSRVRLQFGAYTPWRAHHFRWPFYLVFPTREGWTLLGGIPCDRSFLARFQASRVTGPPVRHRAFVEAM